MGSTTFCGTEDPLRSLVDACPGHPQASRCRSTLDQAASSRCIGLKTPGLAMLLATSLWFAGQAQGSADGVVLGALEQPSCKESPAIAARPLVVTSQPAVHDPAGWKPYESAEPVQPRLFDLFKTQAGSVSNCLNDSATRSQSPTHHGTCSSFPATRIDPASGWFRLPLIAGGMHATDGSGRRTHFCSGARYSTSVATCRSSEPATSIPMEDRNCCSGTAVTMKMDTRSSTMVSASMPTSAGSTTDGLCATN